ncbi:16S rRNA (adenine(1518)-N(6)/adenine(1519)-N(6))-dimethyltransferase RsmA [Legionella jordanis]|uniref:Ribosomal RNA small subunit methyltransferase A n=1 Tax=Legionella jordanis TaxID=456 RepID=A0A0W0VEA7_9GAMM|nr:16S rRNA (adenine(1518)-N(6)/adenine(1519)-N(6))-dimethyltransferase RsmA [Legionella jordanis]KTD17977.1 dimethyladenosine transferase [Legionella jordanis]RMX02333.1 16S rRNA (adenine(1518)-N(6)/adenine(1519)-N(6))-dimethyltransferase RsmA [Legionella jordanis]RMX15787.1 16S rRNA (adenine(1518)-N(6)/adenine(1519)-N(6))-dimethyltransferase RsmA [Legionella jordanis]VEH13931.1 dimethyladenosine transferase [Legionella jordanis]HAT8714310.1 16S rRNA (adenine(1518)-N(6)/adenine(1519)-N(6))-di
MKHNPRKRFGQNFLQDRQIINQILSAANLKPEDKVVEIGPGLGALTKPLLRQLNHLNAIEIDQDLLEHLRQLPEAEEKLTLLSADALTVDYSQWGKHLRILGNLPYNISTPLLLHLVNYAPFIDDMHFMLQKEVVLRIAAEPGTKAYGRLTIMLQYFCDVTYLFDVPPEAFYPKPKVDSAIVRLKPYRQSPFPAVNVARLEHLVAQAFSMRRKTVANNLKPFLNAAQLNDLGIDASLRPEQLSIAEYVRLAKFMDN